MAAAAKAARREMMDRIRENKASNGERGAKKERPAQPQQQRQGQAPKPRRANGNGNGNGQHQQHAQRRDRNEPRVDDPREDRDDDRMPTHIDPLKTNLPTRRDMTGVKRVNGNGQPDPTRTSIDSMGASGKNRNRNRGNGGGFGGQRSQGRFGTR
jgi:ATP-dependent RNA helicase RhlE